jgi:hypothetical protein
MLTKYPPPHFCTGNNICSKSQVAKYKDFLHCQINTDRLLWLLLRKKERFLFASFFVLSIIQNPPPTSFCSCLLFLPLQLGVPNHWKIFK